METIGSRRLRSYLSTDERPIEKRSGLQEVSATRVRQDLGVSVQSYLDLAEKVATVQFHNPDFVFLYRGQVNDYTRKKSSTLKPGIFRGNAVLSTLEQANPSPDELSERYRKLRDAEDALVRLYPYHQGLGRLKRQRILRWTILQHYEICDTPLLDVTQSLRIAASFASLRGAEQGYVYMLGLPNISAAVTASAEAGLQIIRLSTACPPEARRPHLQEGYLIGEYPDISDITQKAQYEPYEVDFGRRLVAKFRFDPNRFWDPEGPFPPVPDGALYPDAGDPMIEIRDRIRSNLFR